MKKIVLIRHGESAWNKENRFTGWADVDLSPAGVEEAQAAGRLLKAEGYGFDIAFTSVLKRAIRTLHLGLDAMDAAWIPEEKHWRLNERHYGALTGLNKAETAQKYGDAQVLVWRRSYDIRPPLMEPGDASNPARDARYAALRSQEVPRGECLKDTVERVMPYWNERIVPAVKAGQRVLVAAHGNSLRALVKHLDAIADDKIVELNIPTARPLVYELDDAMKPLRSYYLGDAEEIARAAAAVANQGKAR